MTPSRVNRDYHTYMNSESHHSSHVHQPDSEKTVVAVQKRFTLPQREQNSYSLPGAPHRWLHQPRCTSELTDIFASRPQLNFQSSFVRSILVSALLKETAMLFNLHLIGRVVAICHQSRHYESASFLLLYWNVWDFGSDAHFSLPHHNSKNSLHHHQFLSISNPIPSKPRDNVTSLNSLPSPARFFLTRCEYVAWGVAIACIHSESSYLYFHHIASKRPTSTGQLAHICPPAIIEEASQISFEPPPGVDNYGAPLITLSIKEASPHNDEISECAPITWPTITRRSMPHTMNLLPHSEPWTYHAYVQSQF